MKQTILAIALTLAFAGVRAQTTTTPPCPPGTITCNNSTQHMGNTTQTATANDNQAQTTQAGNAANSIASGVTITPSIQQSGNAVTQNGNSVQGGNASATGNSSDNKSSASTGASSANNTGMNGLGGNATTGASTATVAPITNTLTSAPIANSNALTGGASTSNSSASGGTQSLTGGNQKQGQTSANTLTGGSQRTRTSADNSGGNSSTSVDASDHSVSNDRLTVLPMQPAVPMSISPASSIAVMVDPQCGPYQRVIQTPVYGLFFGITHTSRKVIDHDDTLADPTPEALDSMWGGRAVYTVSTVNLAGARSISLGGGGSSGGWGQGNTGTTSSMTAQVTHIQMRVCRMQVAQPPRVVFVPAVAAPAPVVHHIWHKRVMKNCPPSK